MTNLPAQEVLNIYRKLLNIERSFRMSKSDLKARPIYARTENSINAQLNIVMAALAVSHLMEDATGLTIKRLVRTLKNCRSIEVAIAGNVIYAAIPPTRRRSTDRSSNHTALISALI